MEKRPGTINKKLKIQNRQSGKTLHKDYSSKPYGNPGALSVANIRAVWGAKLSLGYNSVGIEVGIEMPVECSPNDTKTVVMELRKLKKIVRNEADREAKKARLLLNELKKKK